MHIKGTITRAFEGPGEGRTTIFVALEAPELMKEIDGSHQAPGGQLRLQTSGEPPEVGEEFDAEIDDDNLADGSTPIVIERHEEPKK